MTTKAFVGDVILAVGNGASPEVFVDYCEVDENTGIGVKNDQIDATNFCSGGSKEFIPGLSEGNEVTIGANYSLDDTVQDDLMDRTDNKEVVNFRVTMGSTMGKIFSFSLAMLSWELAPSVADKNKITFTGKITGPIVRTDA